MIQLTIAPRGSQELDLSGYMDVDEDPTPSSEHERDAFERAYGDVSLHLSNMNGYVESILTGLPAQTTWDVIIRDNGRITFRGTVERPVSYSAARKWVTLKAFSKNKEFWERAKVTTIKPFGRTFIKVSDPYGIYSTVEKVIQLNCDQFNSDGMFSGYQIDELYKNRPIRFAYDSTDPNIANDGRYEDLDPGTSVESLLKAFALYYNAQFFIDPELNALRMIRRNSIVNDTRHPLDEVIKNEDDIIYDDTDQKKYDYAKSIVGLPKPQQISNIIERRRVVLSGNPYYVMTFVVDSEGEDVESEVSEPSYTDQRIDVNNSPSDPFYNDYSFFLRRWFTLPLGPSGTTRRNVYTYDGLTSKPRLLFSAENNTQTEVTFDGYNPVGTKEINPAILPPLAYYYSYNETTEKWNTPYIRKVSDSAPAGKVFPITPDLKFIDTTGKVKDVNIFDVFAIFGREIGLVTFSEQWLDLFITKGKIKASVTDTAYCVGDTFVSDRGFFGAGKFVVKKVTPHLFKKFSEVELIKA